MTKNTITTLSDIGERGWLDFLGESLAGSSSPSLLVPVGDDAAVWSPPPGRSLVVTSDVMVEGTHFKRSWLGWKGLAWRAVLAAASDVTAMGGTPTGFTVSLGVPARTRVADLRALAEGLVELSSELSLLVLGGDTVRSDRILVDVTVIGSVAPEEILRQTGAQAGDALWVTGALGASRALLQQVLSWHRSSTPVPAGRKARGCLDDPLFRPPARWPILGPLRKAIPIRALTDLSDGLSADLLKILRHGPLGAGIHLDRVPVHPSLSETGTVDGIETHECAFLGGEDYELLVVESGDAQSVDVIDLAGVPLTRIGKVTDSPTGIECFWHGEPHTLSQRGFEHFG